MGDSGPAAINVDSGGVRGADDQAPAGQIKCLSEVKAEETEGGLEDGFPWPWFGRASLL